MGYMCQGTCLCFFLLYIHVTNNFSLAQMNGGAYGVEVDLYAFAITAVEILTGDLVYPSELPDDVVCAEIANPALTVLRIRHMFKKYASVGKLTAVIDLICDFIMMRKNSASSLICLIETLFALVPVCE